MTTAFLAFAGASVLVILIPGPDTLVVLRGVLMFGRRTGAMTALGVVTGLTVWVSAATVGLTAILRASHDGYLALRVAGAVYLVYMGVQALRDRALGLSADLSAPGRPLIGRGYRAGLATDLLNPKVGVFCITFLPAFVPKGSPVALVTLAMGAMFVIETGIYFVAMLLFVERLKRGLGNERVRRRLNRVTGVVLIGFGLRLAVES